MIGENGLAAKLLFYSLVAIMGDDARQRYLRRCGAKGYRSGSSSISPASELGAQ